MLLYHLSPSLMGSLRFDVHGLVNIYCESPRKNVEHTLRVLIHFLGAGEGRERQCLFARYKIDRALRISVL